MRDQLLPDRSGPVTDSGRYRILDSLRGIALLGICLANFPEFALYTFQKKEVTDAMSTAGIDHVIKYLQYIFIDGKFYTMFSVLFGIGFSIIMSRAMQKGGTGMAVFYRRMAVLALIGLLHLMFLWSGDILLLYALLGMLLPLFRNVSDKKLLTVSALLILFPVVIDTAIAATGYRFNPSAPVIRATQYFNRRNGITDNNFGVWLLNGQSYADVFKFLVSGAFIRMQEFIEGNRVFKVLGLFLLGLYIGRNRIYATLESRKALLMKVCMYGFAIGLPASVLYAWNALNMRPLGLIGYSVTYAAGVVPLSLAYMSAISLLSIGGNRRGRLFATLAAPGRMALTNYIGQSVAGIIIFYGIGFGLGATTGLAYVELIAAGVFTVQIFCSCVWMHYMQFGPLEWVWRMFTYGKRLKIRKQKN
jgi:uncharacterized protein